MERKECACRRGFTLIELLVVVAIIGLLASIMLPSLSKARELAKAASCLSNMKNLGTMLMVYTADNSRLYPTAYSYNNGEGSALDASGVGGYHHWSAALEPNEYTTPVTAAKYPRTSGLFTCPTHASGGWAPSNFTTTRLPSPPAGQISADPTMDDRQVPRLSYVANEIIMPRKKFSAAHDAANAAGANTSNLVQVSADEIETAGNTILLAEFSDSPNCIWGNSAAGGGAYKSHRPTNGVKSSQTGGVFDGEKYTPGTTVNKLTVAEAVAAIKAAKEDTSANKTVAAAQHHIAYINPATHGNNSSNYVFADGHAAKATLEQTLEPGNYMWGKKVYSCVDKPLIND